MGFIRHIQQEKFIFMNQKIGKVHNVFPYSLFKLVKISLNRLLPSRAYIRFSLQEKYKKSYLNC